MSVQLCDAVDGRRYLGVLRPCLVSPVGADVAYFRRHQHVSDARYKPLSRCFVELIPRGSLPVTSKVRYAAGHQARVRARPSQAAATVTARVPAALAIAAPTRRVRSRVSVSTAAVLNVV